MLSRTRSFVAALAIVMVASAAFAVAGSEAVELRSSLEQHFDILPLSDGMLLRARDEGARPRTVEISSGAIALDGQSVGSDELRVRLGDEVAELILAVVDLDEAARQEVLLAPASEEGVAEEETAEKAAAEEGSVVVESTSETSRDASAESEDEDRSRRDKKRKYRRTGDSEVAFAGNLTVDRREVTEDVLVIGGLLKVEGRVEGDATVIFGSATIEGEVTGEVTAIGRSNRAFIVFRIAPN